MMESMTTQTRSTIIPSHRYRNALAAIDWLVRVFGFEKNAVYMADNETVAHAQLTFSGGMLMLGSADNGSEYGKLMVHPDETGLLAPKRKEQRLSSTYAIWTTAAADLPAAISKAIYGASEPTIPGPNTNKQF